jgi:glycosyltransferase involved in cell wall biosynthesis
MKILIAVDHLRIGGAERVALDQGYLSSDLGHEVTILQFNGSANLTNPNFLESEHKVMSNKNISLLDFSGSRLYQFLRTAKLLFETKPDLLIVHSLRGAVFLHIVRKSLSLKIPMTVTIHQLVELSGGLQRFKRFLYAQTADVLFACSYAMTKQWEYYSKQNSFGRFFFKKQISLLRNGIYLDRIRDPKNFGQSENLVADAEKPALIRIISLGRNVHWKRHDKFLAAIESLEGINFEILMMRPSYDSKFETELLKRFGHRIKFKYGLTVSTINARMGDIHLYPTDSGSNSQSSINVLEMCAMSIPSFVSVGGGDLWPELVEAGIIVEVDWENPDVVRSKILKCAVHDFKANQDRVRSLVSIEHNIKKHLEIINC